MNKKISADVFASRLRTTMEMRHLNQTTLAEKAGCKRQTVGRCLQGWFPEVQTLVNMALALDVSADWLLGVGNSILPLITNNQELVFCCEVHYPVRASGMVACNSLEVAGPLRDYLESYAKPFSVSKFCSIESLPR